MELMSAEHLTIDCELSVAEREFAVCRTRRNGIRQYAAHRIFSIVRDDLLTEIHHTSALSNDVSASFCKRFDSSPCSLVGDERLQMFLWVAAWQIEQVYVIEAWFLCLRIKEVGLFITVERLLVDERKTLCIAGDTKGSVPTGRRIAVFGDTACVLQCREQM